MSVEGRLKRRAALATPGPLLSDVLTLSGTNRVYSESPWCCTSIHQVSLVMFSY